MIGDYIIYMEQMLLNTRYRGGGGGGGELIQIVNAK